MEMNDFEEKLDLRYKRIEIILTLISVIFAFFGTIIQVRIDKLNTLYREQIEEGKRVKINLVSNMFYKDNRNYPHLRFYKGNQGALDVTLDDQIEAKEYEKLDETEKLLIDECLKNASYSIDKNNNIGTVYLTRLRDKYIVMLNLVEPSSSVFIEHNDAVLTFENLGSTMTKMKINEVKIKYHNKADYKVCSGIKDNEINILLKQGDTFELILDEASTRLKNSICSIDSKTFRQAQDFDLLQTAILGESVYDELIFNCSFWNEYDEKFTYDVGIKRNGLYYEVYNNLHSSRKKIL